MRHNSSEHEQAALTLATKAKQQRLQPSVLAMAVSLALGLVYPAAAYAVSDPNSLKVEHLYPESSFTQGNPLANHEEWFQDAGQAQAQQAQAQAQAQAQQAQAQSAQSAAGAEMSAVERARQAAMQARQAAMQAHGQARQTEQQSNTVAQQQAQQAQLQAQQAQQQAQLQAQQRAQQQAQLQAQQQAQLRAQQQAQAQQQRAAAQQQANFYGGIQPIPMGNGSLQVPAPREGFNYSHNAQYHAQGNGRFDIPAFAPQDSVPVPEDQTKINPLASPFYDPITGGIDMAKMRRAEIEKRITQGKKLPQEMTPNEQMEARLKSYDRSQYEIQINSDLFQAFGDFKHHDEVYNSLPTTTDVFYVDRPEDLPMFKEKVAELEKQVGAPIGFVLFDNAGLIVLKDNTDFPLQGLTSFHLAYAVASLMSTRGDNGSVTFSFLPKDIRRDIVSPLVRDLDRTNAIGYKSPEVIEAQTPTTTGAERGRGIAEYMRSNQGSNLDKKTREEMMNYSRRLNRNYQEDSKRSSADPFLLSLNELMHYTLGEGDPNASKLLLSYIGTLPALQLFDRVQGLKRVQFKHLQADAAANPELVRQSTAPLYESARLLAAFNQDSKLSADARAIVENQLYFNPLDRNLIQKGVQNSIEFFGKKNKIMVDLHDNEGYSVYSIKGDGGYDAKTDRRTVMSDMALIKYRKHTVVMIIAIKEIPNNELQSLRNSEKVISGLANFLYDYYLERNAELLFPDE